jgi:hypothetical protein
MRPGDRGDCALECYFAVGRDDIVWRPRHRALHGRIEMRIDVLDGKVGLGGIGYNVHAGEPADRARARNRQIDRDILSLEGLHEIEIVRRNVDLLLLP